MSTYLVTHNAGMKMKSCSSINVTIWFKIVHMKSCHCEIKYVMVLFFGWMFNFGKDNEDLKGVREVMFWVDFIKCFWLFWTQCRSKERLQTVKYTKAFENGCIIYDYCYFNKRIFIWRKHQIWNIKALENHWLLI